MCLRCSLHAQISTHSLTRRLTIRPLTRMEYRLNFNSQPHKEADYICRPSRDSINISTHSLTRRLTSVTLQGNVLTLFQLTASQGG